MAPIFITGTGTGIGKTLVAAILAQALQANYWKPVQAGFDEGTDTDWLKKVVSHASFKAFPEIYRLRMPASPHIAARHEGISISIEKICGGSPQSEAPLLIEGAGGLMVPLNENEFVIDLVKKLNAKVILVSRNYLGSINHSLLTAAVCKQNNIEVLGWIFNDHYMNYENEIVQWSGYSKIASLSFVKDVTADWIYQQANSIKSN